MLQYELVRVFRNKLLYVAIAIGVIASGLGLISFYNDIYYSYATGLRDEVSCYEAWLYCSSLGNRTIYRLIMPLLVCLPFVDSYLNDFQSGRLNYILIRKSFSAYFKAKMIAVAVSAATVVLAILSIWFLVVALLFPNALPNSELNYYPYGPFDYLYPTKPLSYIAVAIGLNVLSGILYAWIGLGAAVFFRKKFLVVCTPFLLYFGQVILSQIFSMPVHFLFPVVMIVPYESTESTYMTLVSSYVFIALIAMVLLYKLKGKDGKEYL